MVVTSTRLRRLGCSSSRSARPQSACRLRGRRARPWRPQRSALQLIGDLSHNDQLRAWGRKGNWRLGSSSLLWQWKQRIDRRFMAGFQPNPSMQPSMERAAIDNDRQMACRGCAAKLPAEPHRCSCGGWAGKTWAEPQRCRLDRGDPPPCRASMVSRPWSATPGSTAG